MDMKFDDAIAEIAAEKSNEQTVVVLSDFHLALIGGGGGDVVFA